LYPLSSIVKISYLSIATGSDTIGGRADLPIEAELSNLSLLNFLHMDSLSLSISLQATIPIS
jgi:hypothetical protein